MEKDKFASVLLAFEEGVQQVHRSERHIQPGKEHRGGVVPLIQHPCFRVGFDDEHFVVFGILVDEHVDVVAAVPVGTGDVVVRNARFVARRDEHLPLTELKLGCVRREGCVVLWRPLKRVVPGVGVSTLGVVVRFSPHIAVDRHIEERGCPTPGRFCVVELLIFWRADVPSEDAVHPVNRPVDVLCVDGVLVVGRPLNYYGGDESSVASAIVWLAVVHLVLDLVVPLSGAVAGVFEDAHPQFVLVLAQFGFVVLFERFVVGRGHIVDVGQVG